MGFGVPCKVKLGISHHSLNAARDQITMEKALVFVVEPPKMMMVRVAKRKRRRRRTNPQSP